MCVHGEWSASGEDSGYRGQVPHRNANFRQIKFYIYIYIYIYIHTHTQHRVSICDGSFTTIRFYDACRVGPSTPDVWCITVANLASFLYLVRF